MCGIAGIIAFAGDVEIGLDDLRRMSAAIAHRGPDGDGEYLSINGGGPRCALAFRRLAILDPDPRAMQPMHLLDVAARPRLSLVFNGEIYNYRELRRELTALRPEYIWRTSGDTEVLLMAFDVWRMECLKRLNGMFAFAVWDAVKQELFIARDPMGQKPLYYATARDNRAIAFASELVALRRLPWFDSSINSEALRHYLRWGYTPPAATIYRGVAKLPPCRWMRFKVKGIESASYFDPNNNDPHVDIPASEETPAQTTRRLVLAAVKRQLVSDVPLGCFLSGGIDSSIMAAAMKAASPGEPPLTFSIGFAEKGYDETAHAAAVAGHLGNRHHRFEVLPDAAADLPGLARVFGEPFGDSSALPTHYLARETRRHVKVALSGDGGDELFGGYDRYRAIRMGRMLRMLPAAVRQSIAASLPAGNPKSKSAKLRRLLEADSANPAARYAKYVELFDDDTVAEMMGEVTKTSIDGGMIATLFESLQRSGRDLVQSALAVDRLTYLPEDLLTKVDRASMLHALEVRSPFMDPELVTFAAGLSAGELLEGGPKRLLREAFAADLPPEVFARRKMGFAVPIGEWFRGSLRGLLHDNLKAHDSFAREHFQMPVIERLLEEHDQQRIDHTQRLYALLMLELWKRECEG